MFQKRFNGSVDFDRNWDDYRNGFGSLDGEFWYGKYTAHQNFSETGYTRKFLETFDVMTVSCWCSFFFILNRYICVRIRYVVVIQGRNNFFVRKAHAQILYSTKIPVATILNNAIQTITQAHHSKIAHRSILVTFASNIKRKIVTW